MADLLDTEYRLLKLLGSGFSGLVYLAERIDSGEQVAIKEFPASRAATSHFLRELSTLFTLQHPNLVRCKNLIYGGQKKSYLIMELADGGSLRQQLSREGALCPKQARRILTELLLGLSHLHESGIVHCDLKPENILIFGQTTDRPVYKITDLGIARFQASEEHRGTPGSALYMAPEQFYDKATEFSDIYSLGVVFFEMLSGQFLFDGEPDQLFAFHVNEEPNLAVIECEKCRQLLTKMLAKSPSDRPSSPHQALSMIDRLWDSSEEREALPESRPSVLPAGDFAPSASRPVPGARRLLRGAGHNLVLARQLGSDLYEPKRDLLKPLFFSDVLSCENSLANPQRLLAGKKWVYRIEKKNKLRPLFQTTVPAKALVGPDNKGRVLYADSQRLFCCSILGEQLWSVPISNYFLEPQLSLCHESERVYITSGPSDPHLSCICLNSQELLSYQLPGPSVGLEIREHGLTCYTLPLEREQGTQVWHLGENGTWSLTENLKACVSRVRVVQDLTFLFATGSVQVRNQQGQELVRMDLEGAPFDACWCPESKRFLVLTQWAGNTILHTFSGVEVLAPANLEERANHE